jgi:hypothetical protein
VRHEAHEKAVLKGTRALSRSTRTYYSLAFLPRSLFRKRYHSLSTTTTTLTLAFSFMRICTKRETRAR